jgi:hypothetical protein
MDNLSSSQRDTLRLAGAVTITAGILVLLVRKGDDWADFPLLLVVGIPFLLFYGLGTGAIQLGGGDGDGGGLPAWRATALVLGILFAAATFSQAIETIGGDPNKSGWVFVIFLLTSVSAAFAAAVHGLRYGWLLAGLAAIVSWMALLDAIFDPSATAVRWFFLIIAVLLAAVAWMQKDSDPEETTELVTAAGVAAVAAGVTALLAAAGSLIGASIGAAFGGAPDFSGVSRQRDEWDFFLLVVSVALIWYGARAPWRGPAYVGAIGLLAFVLSAGTDIASILEGDEASTDLVGWPLLLLVLGGAALAAGLLAGGGGGKATAPASSSASAESDYPSENSP